MADPLSIAASIIGIAAAGVKLSSTLYTYTETVLSADKHVKEIARDLSRTSTVITELGTLLSQDDGAQLFSQGTLGAAKDTVLECDEVFKEIQKELEKNLDYDGDDEVKKSSKLRRLKWPLVEPKMRVLQGRLERLKNTLSLMLNVATCSRKLATSDTCSVITNPDAQQRQIEHLILLNEQAHARYTGLEKILQTLDPVPSYSSSFPDTYDLAVRTSPQPTNDQAAGVDDEIKHSIDASNPHKEEEPVHQNQPSERSSTNISERGNPILRSSTTCSSCLSRSTILASQFSASSARTKRTSSQISPQELDTCTGAVRKLLEQLEDARSIQSSVERCEIVRYAYQQSVESLASIIPINETVPKRSRMDRIFGRNRILQNRPS